jgi:hypothetical protein
MGVLVKLNKITWWINHVEISDISGMPILKSKFLFLVLRTCEELM